MSYLLQKGFRSNDPEPGENQFHVIQVTQITCYDAVGASCNGKFHQMDVTVWPHIFNLKISVGDERSAGNAGRLWV